MFWIRFGIFGFVIGFVVCLRRVKRERKRYYIWLLETEEDGGLEAPRVAGDGGVMKLWAFLEIRYLCLCLFWFDDDDV